MGSGKSTAHARATKKPTLYSQGVGSILKQRQSHRVKTRTYVQRKFVRNNMCLQLIYRCSTAV